MLISELRLLRIAWPWILLGIVWQYVHNVMHNLVYYLEGSHKVYGGVENRLVDLGFLALPEINTVNMSFLPNNGVLYSLFFVCIFFIISPLILNISSHSPVQVTWRVLTVSVMTVTLRMLSFILTLLPSPGEHCSEEEFTPPSVSEIFSRLDTDGGCGDLVFSSHQMYALLLSCAVTEYLPNGIWKFLCIPVWLLSLALSLLIVAQRAHYTVDVFAAWYAVPLCWISFRWLFPWDIKTTVCFWRDQPTVEYKELYPKADLPIEPVEVQW